MRDLSQLHRLRTRRHMQGDDFPTCGSNTKIIIYARWIADKPSTELTKYFRSFRNLKIPSDRTVYWDIACRLRNPSSRWKLGHSCTNIEI